jgi:segregation and condensation protein B
METATDFADEYANGNGNGNGYHADPAPDATEQPARELGRLPALIESLLFAAGAPVPLARLVDALGGPERREVSAALTKLAESYERDGRGLRLVQVAGGWQLRTPAEHGPWIRRLLRERPPRLSRPMLETLAIVAYRQPCTRIEIEAIRGVEADAVLSTLLDRRLVRIMGRKDAPGRPLLYGTTREFLEVFGLPDLEALPALRELDSAAGLLAGLGAAAEANGAAAQADGELASEEGAGEESATPDAPTPEGDE